MSEVEERNYTQERLQSVERPLESQLPAVTQKPKSGGRGITFAVLLIGLGIALLLSNLGIIAFSWAVLLNFWPVVLILIGLDMMLGGRSAAGSAFLGLISLFIVMGVIFWASQMPAPGGPLVTHPIEFQLEGANVLDVDLSLGAGNTTIDVLQNSPLAVQGGFETREDTSFEAAYRVDNDHGFMTFSQSEGMMTPNDLFGNLELALTNAIPINLMIDAGVGELNLHLTDLLLQSLNIDAGAGNVNVDLPDHGSYTVDISAGVGNVEIELPDDMEARIEFDSGLGNFEIDDERFEQVSEGVWESENFEAGAANTVEMNIDAGAGNIEITD